MHIICVGFALRRHGHFEIFSRAGVPPKVGQQIVLHFLRGLVDMATHGIGFA